jgi:hypothetical protein
VYDHSTLDRDNGIFARWDEGTAHLFMRGPGGWVYGYFPKGSKMPVFASFRRPTPEDGACTEHWAGCVPGTGFQIGQIRYESGLVHVCLRRVRWPTVEGRPDWQPPMPSLWQRIGPVPTLPRSLLKPSLWRRLMQWWQPKPVLAKRIEPVVHLDSLSAAVTRYPTPK